MTNRPSTTYIFGAGASLHAGYPLIKSMGRDLTQWMRAREGTVFLPFRQTVEDLEQHFGDITDFERLLDDCEHIVNARQIGYSLFADVYRPALKQALREWFDEILHRSRPRAYRQLAEELILPDDQVISFNYDVSLDRELKLADLWSLGDGYSFPVEGFDNGSPVKILKLHGSIGWLANALPGSRPVFLDSDLIALGYSNHIDPKVPRAGLAAIQPLILPTTKKEFYFDTNLGPIWKGFWNHLWDCAKSALRNSERIVICGYGLYGIDERGRDLMLSEPFAADFEVCCGNDTQRIVEELRSKGQKAHAAERLYFEGWVDSQVADKPTL
jgi:hypothetical protein